MSLKYANSWKTKCFQSSSSRTNSLAFANGRISNSTCSSPWTTSPSIESSAEVALARFMDAGRRTRAKCASIHSLVIWWWLFRYAMKCLDKKRIKLKQGETLALNERIMLSLVSTGMDCPFIVSMSYAFTTPDKLCFILDLMNGGDLHYHLSQHGVFSEQEVLFYASEVILGELIFVEFDWIRWF